eukprot:4545950-Amphidinium_carterae.1
MTKAPMPAMPVVGNGILISPTLLRLTTRLLLRSTLSFMATISVGVPLSRKKFTEMQILES